MASPSPLSSACPRRGLTIRNARSEFINDPCSSVDELAMKLVGLPVVFGRPSAHARARRDKGGKRTRNDERGRAANGDEVDGSRTVAKEKVWYEVWDAEYRRCYYYCPSDGVSQWTEPESALFCAGLSVAELASIASGHDDAGAARGCSLGVDHGGHGEDVCHLVYECPEGRRMRALRAMQKSESEEKEERDEEQQRQWDDNEDGHIEDGHIEDGLEDSLSSEHPPFYYVRYSLFSLFDCGIAMGEGVQAWYSVTPETIAHHHTQRILREILDARELHCSSGSGPSLSVPDSSESQTSRAPKSDAPHPQPRPIRILDCFSGVGGNAIAFASCDSVAQVVGIEHNQSMADASVNNARVYGVHDKFTVLQSDVFAALEEIVLKIRRGAGQVSKACGLDARMPECNEGGAFDDECNAGDGDIADCERFDGIFLSPPWGGPEYKDSTVFDVEGMRLREGPAGHTSVADGRSDQEGPERRDDVRDIVSLLSLCFEACPIGCVAIYLPRNTDTESLIRVCTRLGCSAHVEKNWLGIKLKAITVYFRRDEPFGSSSPSGNGTPRVRGSSSACGAVADGSSREDVAAS